MFDNVYIGSIAKREEKKAENMLELLYDFFNKNFHYVQEEYIHLEKEGIKDRIICDYISGMTDRYAVKMFEKYFIPRYWMSIDV